MPQLKKSLVDCWPTNLINYTKILYNNDNKNLKNNLLLFFYFFFFFFCRKSFYYFHNYSWYKKKLSYYLKGAKGVGMIWNSLKGQRLCLVHISTKLRGGNFFPPRLTHLSQLRHARVFPASQRWWGRDGARF